MTRLLHLSDTHFGTEIPAVVDALRRLCERTRPVLALLSGDVTQRARPEQFAAAAAFMQSLPAPARLVVPGNHDVPLFDLPTRLMRPYARYRTAFGYLLEPSFEDAEWLVLSVNTTRWYRHKNGEIDPQQIDMVSERLRAASRNQLRVVVTHHPLVVIEESDRDNQPHRWQQALVAWAEAGVDLVLGGHIHLPYVTPVEPLKDRISAGRPALSPSSLQGTASLVAPDAAVQRSRRVWAVQAGTATSSRIREGIPNSVNLISTDDHRYGRVCHVETWQFDAGSGEFASVSQRTLALSD